MRAAAMLLLLAAGCTDGVPSRPGPSAAAPDPRLLAGLGYADFVDVDDPDGRPDGVIVRDPGRVAPGWSLVSVHGGGIALLLDEHGELLHRWKTDDRRWGNAELLDDGRLLVSALTGDGRYVLRLLDWDSEVLWTADVRAHHDAEVHPDGDKVVVLTFRDREDPEVDAEHIFRDEQITLLDLADGSVLGERSFHDMWKATEPGPGWIDKRWTDLPRKGVVRVDLYHSNSIEWMRRPGLAAVDPVYAAGNVLVSFRNQERVAIFDYAAGRLVWQWGMGEISGSHDASVLDNGNVLVFDNGLDRGWSRVVEVDPRSSRVVWEYRGETEGDLWAESRSSAQRLSNGNTLICEADQGRAREVTPAGEVVWEYWHPATDGKVGTLVRLYRLEAARVARLRAGPGRELPPIGG